MSAAIRGESMTLEHSPSSEGINPLNQFALNGRSDALSKLAQQQVPLMAGLAVRGQAGVWYANPNCGKTVSGLKLLVLDIEAGLIAGQDCYYVAADDGAAGVLEKLAILEPYRVNVLAPGLRGFDAKNLAALMQQAIDNGTAKRRFVIADTIKKFTNLMDKSESSRFAAQVRLFTLHGGSFLGLAHTNKRTDREGNPIFAGTSDLVDDSDFIFTMRQVASVIAGKKIIQADCIKGRGSVVDRALITYSNAAGLTYRDLLASVETLSAAQQVQLESQIALSRDAEVIAAVEDAIHSGTTGKMAIARLVSGQQKIGRQSVDTIIDKYNGSDPTTHRWDHSVGPRGLRTYRLIAGTPGGLPVEPEEIF